MKHFSSNKHCVKFILVEKSDLTSDNSPSELLLNTRILGAILVDKLATKIVNTTHYTDIEDSL